MRTPTPFSRLLLLSGGATAAALLVPGFRPLTLTLAAVAFGGLLWREHRQPDLNRRDVFIASGVLLLLAVAAPVQGSRDVWSYATYGRIAAHYHQSPYRRTPADFAADPIARRVAEGWDGAPSVYGPAFVAVAATGSSVAGSSPLANRLFFQGLAAAAILAVLVLLWRRGADAGALAFIGLNPVVVAVVVNGGHNDALVGAAVLAGVLTARVRPGVAGLALALAALVKVVALLALAAVALWLWRAHGRRAAAALAASGGVAVAAGYALAGGMVALRPVLADRGFHSRASIWTTLRGLGPAFRSPTIASVVVGLVVLAVLAGPAKRTLPVALAGALSAYLLAAPYVLPWYWMWAVPALALAWRTRLAALLSAYACALGVAFAMAPSSGVDVVLSLAAVVMLASVIRCCWVADPGMRAAWPNNLQASASRS